MKKYILQNIDCADCASKIEKAVSSLKSVKKVTVSFASSSMLIDTADIDEVKRIIKQAEPLVEVIPETRASTSFQKDTLNKSSYVKNGILRLLVIVFIFIIGLVFQDSLHNSDYEIFEYIIFLTAYLVSGWSVLYKALKNLFRGKVFDENFLMSIATLGAIAIHQLPEAVAVMLFYQLGEFLQGLSVRKSRNSVKSLLAIRPDSANLKLGDEVKKVSPENIKIGDLIIVKPGERIPLDGMITDGISAVDTSALTGESMHRSIRENDEVLAGMINLTALLTIKVTKNFEESSISKILNLVEKATQKKAETEKFITKFASYYTPAVVLVALLVAFVPPLLSGADLYSSVYKALVLLVISCPCALVISIPLGYFGGIGGASRKGVLVKGSNFLDALTMVKTVVFDKTGTLTKGKFVVTGIVSRNGFSKDKILELAAMAESQSNHPLAQSILKAYGKRIDSDSIKNVEEIAGEGIKAVIDNYTVLAGNDRLLHSMKIEHDVCDVNATVVHVAVDNKYAGYISIADELKEDAAEAINKLKKSGIRNIIMLTGDNEFAAKETAAKLKIDKVYSELLPQDKVNLMEKIIDGSKNKGKVAFLGDGINDAPVLARADVGIAMGALGSDAAIETADVVLMTDHPSKIVTAIDVAKKTRRIVWQNIIFAFAVKFLFILLGSFGAAKMWEAVFADMGVALLAILNATRVLKN